MAPRRKCPTCGSRQWRKNNVGLVTCSEGHVLQNYINESEEADDMGTHMLRKRSLKSKRKKKEKASKADPKLYHGERARFHYYQCLQLLLRSQISTLISVWDLPPEFETICRDLWALHLNLIPKPPPAEPLHYMREQEGYQLEPEENGSRNLSRTRSGDDGNSQSPENAATMSDGSSSSSEEERLDPEIAVLLEENSDVSSSEESSPGEKAYPRSNDNTHPSSKNPFVSRADRPENTIVVLLLACWTVRLPVVYMDFINVIESHTLPYLDQVRFFPSTLTRHLTKHAVQALSPHHAPRTLTLHRLCSRLAGRLYDTFGIIIPELNAAPVLWRVVQQCFCGTPILYFLTKRLGNVLTLSLSLQSSFATSLSSIKTGENESQKHDNAPPEVSLVATALAVLKLVYGLDGKGRVPIDADDAACAFPDIIDFLATVRDTDQAERSSNSQRFDSRKPMSVGDLDDAALDEYLDYCEKVLVGPKRDEHRVLDNYFPLVSRTAEAPQWNQPEFRGKGLSSTRRSEEEDVVGILEPGELYTIYDSRDVLGNLSPQLKILVEKSARWAGVDLDFLCGVVERYERRLTRWWNAKRQARNREAGDDEGHEILEENEIW